jgi:hypothetical protein
VDLDEEVGERVEHLVAPSAEARADEELAVREREVLVRRDERRGALLARIVRPVLDEPDRAHGRSPGRLEHAEHRVVVAGRSPWQFLHGVDPVRVREEAHLVAADALRQVDQVGDTPLDERALPGEVEEVRVPGADRESRRHGGSAPRRPVVGQAVAGGVVARGASGSRASIRSSKRRLISSPVASRS